MVNINFHESAIKEEKASSSGKGIDPSRFSGGFVVGTIILIITFSILGGLEVYKRYIGNKQAQIDGKISNVTASFDIDRMERLVDFDKRLKIVDQNISNKNDARDNLIKIQEVLLEGVILNSYGYDNDQKTITMEAVADNFQLIAAQMLNFKKSPYFKNVNIDGETSRDETGKIAFNLTVDLANKK